MVIWKIGIVTPDVPLYVFGDARITGDLDVEGTFPQFNNVSGYFNIDQGLTVGIATTIGGDLSVDGGTFFWMQLPRQFGTGNSKSRSETSHL